jgi:hypothetical protein
MEQHAVEQNNKYGLGDKEESFIEQGHQVGLKENKHYQGVTIFQKNGVCNESGNYSNASISH